MKNPEEIVRCLRICRSDCSDCLDDDGRKCSYRLLGECNCINVLLSEAADALAASYSYKKGVNNE